MKLESIKAPMVEPYIPPKIKGILRNEPVI